jgi:hypothetical protein
VSRTLTAAAAAPAPDPREPTTRLLRDLGTRPEGLSDREAERRLAQVGPNEHASLRRVGLTTNRLLLWGIAFEIVFAATLTVLPSLQWVFGTAVPPWWALLLLLPMPVLVWGVDELYRALRTHRPEGADHE